MSTQLPTPPPPLTPPYVYMIPPIDFLWHTLPTLKQWLDQRLEDQASVWENRETSSRILSLDAVITLLSLVEKGTHALLARRCWDGDIRGAMHVFGIPGNEIQFGVVWKQDNNGDCLVVSPVPMPHLERINYDVNPLAGIFPVRTGEEG